MAQDQKPNVESWSVAEVQSWLSECELTSVASQISGRSIFLHSHLLIWLSASQ